MVKKFLLTTILLLWSLTACEQSASLNHRERTAFLNYRKGDLLAFVATTKSQGDLIYLYDPLSQKVLNLGKGNALQWSPNGTYLATITTSDMGTLIYRYTVCDVDRFVCRQHEAGTWTSLFLWSSDEQYFVTGGSGSHGCWSFTLWSGDGSSAVLDGNDVSCAVGDNVGYRPIRWQEEQLLIDYSANLWEGKYPVPDQGDGLYLFAPKDRSWKLTELNPVRAGRWMPEESEKFTWLDHSSSQTSPSGQWLAALQGGTLSILEVSTGKVLNVPMPEDIIRADAIAWSPLIVRNNNK